MKTAPAPAPVLITDSCCDLPAALLEELGVEVLHLRFLIGDEEHVDDLGSSMAHADFYARMRDNATPTTAAIPLVEYADAFTRAAEAGRPALLLGLSSALSSTYEAALTARDMVLSTHPGADIRIVDSLNASIALGLVIFEAARLLASGADIDALEGWVLGARTRSNGYFTLESLEHLRRGGRISDAMAFAGTMLDVRPVLRIDGGGQLVFAGQARGRRKSMTALVDTIAQRVIDAEGQTAFVAHGDALADAEALVEALRTRVPFGDIRITELGPVIGSHVGPGMLAIACWGKERAV